MKETYRRSLQADYLPKDLSLIIIHVYKLSSPEDSPARDGAFIMSKQTTLFLWIWTCIYSCSPHTHIFTYKTHSARSVSGDQTFMKTPVRWHYGSITHSWLQLPPRYDQRLVPLLQLLKKARLHKPQGRCRKRLWPSRSCAASRHREALLDSRAIWTTARSVCAFLQAYGEAGYRIRE